MKADRKSIRSQIKLRCGGLGRFTQISYFKNLFNQPNLRSTCFAIIFLLFSFNSIAAETSYFNLEGGEMHPGSIMRRRDIIFEINKATIRKESHIILDSIAEFLKAHPEFSIEIGQHTHYENPEMSTRLTVSRAKAIMTYLIYQGISASNLTAVGYGDRQKIYVPSSNLSIAKIDSINALNRRTEFKIIGINPNLQKTFLLTDTTFAANSVYRGASIIYNDSRMTDESLAYLDSIADFMMKHPSLSIEIGCHTYYLGSDSYNDKLTEIRAKMILDYLVNKGITKERLSYYGYGETCPFYSGTEFLALSSKEEQDKALQKSFRTEFKIVALK
jgi:outer membrane protein OmpA-like peptidoglycan-associated protein